MLLVAVGVFIGIMALIMGVYWAFILRPEGEAERELNKRLGPTTGAKTAAPGPSLMNRVLPLSTIPALDRALRRSSGTTQPVQSLIDRSGLHMTVGRLVLLTALCFIAPFVGILVLTGDARIALVVGVLVALAPYTVVRFIAARRIARFEEQFPETIDLIARSLRAGHALSTALGVVAEEAPEPVRTEFKLLHDQQNYGMPFPDALRNFAARVPLLDARFFVTAVLTQREAGGNLAEVLDSLAGLIRERFKLRRQVRTLSAHGRFTGWVLGALPFVIGSALFLIAPTEMETLFTDPIGVRIIIGGVVLETIGVFFIRRIVNIEV